MSFLAPIGGWLLSNFSTVASALSTGLSIAGQAGAFGGGGSSSAADALAAEQKKSEEAAAEEERKKKAFLLKMAGGKSGSILTSGQGVRTGANILKTKLGA